MLDYFLISETEFFICDTAGILRLMYLIKVLLNFLRFVVPIVIIVMTMYDLYKNVINPNAKEGVKKIVNRAIAAIIVFLVPTLVDLVMNVINTVFDNKAETDYKISSCYINANKSCIDKIDEYLNCTEFFGEENKKCQEFRRCNNYKLSNSSNSCSVHTLLDNNCKNMNEKDEYLNYFKN